MESVISGCEVVKKRLALVRTNLGLVRTTVKG